MQKHWDVMRSDDAGDSWREISGNLPSDFGFPIAVHAHEPDTVYVVPITSDSEHYPPEGKLRVYRSRTGGDEWEALTEGLPQGDCYVNVLRDAMAVDSLDPCGLYFGTTGGQVYGSADAGRHVGADRARPAPGAVGRGADAAVIRVRLPHHLRTLAGVGQRGRAVGRGAGDPASGARRHRGDLSDAGAGRCAIRPPGGVGRSSGSSPARRTCRSSRPTRRCRRRWPAGPRRCTWSARWPAGDGDGGCPGWSVRGRLLTCSPRRGVEQSGSSSGVGLSGRSRRAASSCSSCVRRRPDRRRSRGWRCRAAAPPSRSRCRPATRTARPR